MGWADRISMEDVDDAESFCAFASQTVGIPFPSRPILGKAKKELTELFEQYPHLTWRGLCQLPLWAKERRKRYGQVLQLIHNYRYAYQDGYLPQLDSDFVNDELEEKIAKALQVEQDVSWRQRLLNSRGKMRVQVYEQWATRVDL